MKGMLWICTDFQIRFDLCEPVYVFLSCWVSLAHIALQPLKYLLCNRVWLSCLRSGSRPAFQVASWTVSQTKAIIHLRQDKHVKEQDQISLRHPVPRHHLHCIQPFSSHCDDSRYVSFPLNVMSLRSVPSLLIVWPVI